MTTFTTAHTTTTAQAKYVHAGANSVTAIYSLNGTTLSAGDVLQMVKIPAGAVITDIVMNVQLGSGSATGLAVGDGNSTGRFYGNTSLSAGTVVRATAGVPYSYSVDDTIDVVISGASSATAQGSVTLTVMYKLDDPTGV